MLKQENGLRKDIRVNPVRELKTILKQGGWNQVELAAKLGITQPFLSQVLKGRRGVGNKILESLNIEREVIYRYK